MRKTDASRETVQLDLDGDELVPGVLQVPTTASPAPAVLLLHGFTSRKERMAESIGRALIRHGVASLALDLPLHGERPGSFQGAALNNPMMLVQKWRMALKETQRGIHYLAELPAVDPDRIGLAGYSLGSYIGVIAAAREPLVKAVALAAGGDLPEQTPFAALVRTFADPVRAVRGLARRPLLMVHGKHDRTIRPAQARTLFEAAGEPKEIRWYDGGHWTPAPVVDDVAEWLASRLAARPSAPAEPRDEPGGSSRRPRLRRAS